MVGLTQTLFSFLLSFRNQEKAANHCDKVQHQCYIQHRLITHRVDHIAVTVICKGSEVIYDPGSYLVSGQSYADSVRP